MDDSLRLFEDLENYVLTFLYNGDKIEVTVDELYRVFKLRLLMEGDIAER